MEEKETKKSAAAEAGRETEAWLGIGPGDAEAAIAMMPPLTSHGCGPKAAPQKAAEEEPLRKIYQLSVTGREW